MQPLHFEIDDFHFFFEYYDGHKALAMLPLMETVSCSPPVYPKELKEDIDFQPPEKKPRKGGGRKVITAKLSKYSRGCTNCSKTETTRMYNFHKICGFF